MYCKICGKAISEKRLQQGKQTCCRSCAIKHTKRTHLSDETFAREYRNKLSKARKAYLSTEEGLEKHKQIVKKSWQNPETIKRHSESKKLSWERTSKEQKELHNNNVSLGVKKWYANLDNTSKIEMNRKNSKSQIIRWSKMSIEDRKKLGNKISVALAITNKTEITKLRRSISRQKAAKRQRLSGYYETEEWKDISRKQKQKEYQTKKQRGTFNSSRIAEYCIELLKNKGFNILNNNLEVEYPSMPNLHCDVYLKEIDTYVEFHFSHYHNYRPFDKNNEEHIKELKLLKEKEASHKITSKNTNQYGRIIYNWTDLDVRKRQCAIDNKLNWIAFYSFEEFEQWLNSLEVFNKEINKC